MKGFHIVKMVSPLRRPYKLRPNPKNPELTTCRLYIQLGSSMSNQDDEMLEEYDFSQARRGPVVVAGPNKERITIRIDADILNWFHDYVNSCGGGSYQALCEYINGRDKDWEAVGAGGAEGATGR